MAQLLVERMLLLAMWLLSRVLCMARVVLLMLLVVVLLGGELMVAVLRHSVGLGHG